MIHSVIQNFSPHTYLVCAHGAITHSKAPITNMHTVLVYSVLRTDHPTWPSRRPSPLPRLGNTYVCSIEERETQSSSYKQIACISTSHARKQATRGHTLSHRTPDDFQPPHPLGNQVEQMVKTCHYVVPILSDVLVDATQACCG
jgi:hypothetical protein